MHPWFLTTNFEKTSSVNFLIFLNLHDEKYDKFILTYSSLTLNITYIHFHTNSHLTKTHVLNLLSHFTCSVWISTCIAAYIERWLDNIVYRFLTKTTKSFVFVCWSNCFPSLIKTKFACIVMVLVIARISHNVHWWNTM